MSLDPNRLIIFWNPWKLCVFLGYIVISCSNETKNANLGNDKSIIIKDFGMVNHIQSKDSLNSKINSIKTDSLYNISFEKFVDSLVYSFKFENKIITQKTINRTTFDELIDLEEETKINFANPEVINFLPRYKMYLMWFDIGFDFQESSGKGLILVNSKGEIIEKQIISYDGIERYKFCVSPNQEYVLIDNVLVELRNLNKTYYQDYPIYGGFINNQTITLTYNPTDSSKYYYAHNNGEKVIIHQAYKAINFKNAIIATVKGDTLTNFRFDGYCEEFSHRAYVFFNRLDSLGISYFYDPYNKYIKIVNNKNVIHKNYDLENIPIIKKETKSFFEIQCNCNALDDVIEDFKTIRFYLNENNSIIGYKHVI